MVSKPAALSAATGSGSSVFHWCLEESLGALAGSQSFEPEVAVFLDSALTSRDSNCCGDGINTHAHYAPPADAAARLARGSRTVNSVN